MPHAKQIAEKRSQRRAIEDAKELLRKQLTHTAREQENRVQQHVQNAKYYMKK
jgi:hypothetical protein